MTKQYLVRAVWDPEAEVWFASSNNVPGPATEAGNLESLEAKLQIMIPELLEENGLLATGNTPQRLQLTFITERIS